MAIAALSRRFVGPSIYSSVYNLRNSIYTRSLSPKRIFPAAPRRMLVTISSTILESLKKEGVIPDGLITVSYGKNTEVTLGNLLKPAETQHQPLVNLTVSEDDPSASYTLVLTDPDAPTRGDQKWSEYAHYVACGIKADSEPKELFQLNSSNSTELLKYMGPAPPPKTGKHRYVFLLYRETPGVTPKIFHGDRPNWGTGVPGSGAREWARNNKLTLVAANFFYAQNPEQ